MDLRQWSRILLLAILILSYGCNKNPAEDVFQKGMEAWGKGYYREASKEFERVYILYPSSPRAAQALYYSANICLYNLNDIDKAVELLLEIVDKYPGNRISTEAGLLAGEIIMEKIGDYERALLFYDRFLKKNALLSSADRQRVMHRVSKCLIELRRFNAAMDELEKLYKNGEDRSIKESALFDIAWINFLLGRNREAIKRFEEFLSKFPDSPRIMDAKLWMAYCLEEEGDYQGTRLILEEIRNIYPYRSVIEQKLALLDSKEGKRASPATKKEMVKRKR